MWYYPSLPLRNLKLLIRDTNHWAVWLAAVQWQAAKLFLFFALFTFGRFWLKILKISVFPTL